MKFTSNLIDRFTHTGNFKRKIKKKGFKWISIIMPDVSSGIVCGCDVLIRFTIDDDIDSVIR